MPLPTLNTILFGDCLEVLKGFPDNSIDAIIQDPPAGVSFMGKDWDDPNTWPLRDRGERLTGSGNPTASRGFANGITFEKSKKGREAFIAFMTEVLRECLRVAKPGSHMLIWALPRTSYWTATACDDAGWEIRDCFHHVFFTGYPKSVNISKSIDHFFGKERAYLGEGPYSARRPQNTRGGNVYMMSLDDRRVGHPQTAPATPESEQWNGWGTFTKPAVEHWWLCRKPLEEKTIVEQVLKTGTGALHIDACRVKQERWPSHLLFSHSLFCTDEQCEEGCPILELDQQSGVSTSRKGTRPPSFGATPGVHEGWRRPAHAKYKGKPDAGYNDKGGASRFSMQFHPRDDLDGFLPFLYMPKASNKDRDWGCDDLPLKSAAECVQREEDSAGIQNPRAGAGRTSGHRNNHPTVKNSQMMSYFARLLCPPGGIILDCFAGSGSTGVGAIREGFSFLGIEKDPLYHEIASTRLQSAIEAWKEDEKK